MGKVVGIDLGTTNSVVAVMEGGKPIVIANSEGMRTTPSVVGFNKDGELVVGQLARRQSVLNPENTFYGVKRFMGRQYAELQPESKRVPYTIKRDELGNIKIRCPKLKKEFAPEEVSAMILRKLAEEAERYLGEEITGAVITVPAYFNDSQRQATRDAGRIAGLDVLRIINEPTAAALAYGLDQRRPQTIMVFDLGGGTFDVSVLDIGEGVFEVRSTSGDTQLGGNDFDRRIVDWLAEEFLKQEDIDLRKSDRQALQRLTEAAEKAKIELSKLSVTEINLPFITADENGPKHIEMKLNRAKFEELCGDLVSRLRRPLKRAISDAGLGPMDIDEVVLVGGSTRIPMVQELVRSYIDLEPNQNVNPDEVVAIGAAIQSGIMTNEVKDILLLDVTPLSLGLEAIGGLMNKLLPRNTTIPVRRSDVYSTGENNQTVVEIHVLQGEREMANGNKSLGRFKLTGIPPAPRGVPQIQVSFDIDANGILQVTARDKTTGREQGITVSGASTLSDSEINRMISEAEKFAEEDRARRERVEKRNRAKALTDQAQRKLKEVTLDFGSQFASYYRRRIDVLCEEILKSLEQDDERTLDRSEADLQDTLYELNREVRLQYDNDEDDTFLGAVRKTFLGDDDDYVTDDYSYDPRQTDYYGASSRDPYRNPPGRSGNLSTGYNDYDNGYGAGAGGYRDEPNRFNNSGWDDGYDQRGRQSRRSDRGYNDYDDSSRDLGDRNRRPGYNDPYSNPDAPSFSPPRREPPRNSRLGRDDYPPQDRYSGRNPSRNPPPENDWDDDDDEWF
ncbi:molecular chaperone DnaK [Waterburya agarophytonicola K14]|uniref:Chaperone protein DnaK n=1 Tax=Waterburya agarophytonicola KI4 TaxID=2874699 RepID=A0A964BWP3_9CYAN|nr:molecular chaperone DnaK [Waterburya agarophytonicola]MCC0178910.1 molecular chaperone DnaK [Waterburya agarophytonicola KI4]